MGGVGPDPSTWVNPIAWGESLFDAGKKLYTDNHTVTPSYASGDFNSYIAQLEAAIPGQLEGYKNQYIAANSSRTFTQADIDYATREAVAADKLWEEKKFQAASAAGQYQVELTARLGDYSKGKAAAHGALQGTMYLFNSQTATAPATTLSSLASSLTTALTGDDSTTKAAGSGAASGGASGGTNYIPYIVGGLLLLIAAAVAYKYATKKG